MTCARHSESLDPFGHRSVMHPEFQPTADDLETDVEISEELSEWDPDLLQQVSRIQRSDVDQLVGYYRVRFASGQKREVVHVLIHPPMETVPEVEANGLDAPAHRIRITDRERFGIRIEVVLDTAWSGDEPETFLVEVLATARRPAVPDR